MATRLKEYFPIIREREETPAEIAKSDALQIAAAIPILIVPPMLQTILAQDILTQRSHILNLKKRCTLRRIEEE